MRNYVVAAVLSCVCLITIDARAAIQFSDPNRYVSAINNKGSSNSKYSANFGLFNESARVDWEENWDTGYGTVLSKYHSVGTQNSTITSSGITARGSVEGIGPFYFWGYEPLEQSSSSYFKIDFEIDAPCEVVLTGKLNLLVDVGGTNYDIPDVWVTLSGQTGEVFSQNMQWWYRYGSGSYQKQINESFSLDAGRYTLIACAITHGDYSRHYPPPGIGGGGYASYDITLTPEPATLLLLGLGGLLLRKK